MSVFDDLSGQVKLCDYSFSLAGMNLAPKRAKMLNHLCEGYEAILRSQWGQVRWFMYLASLHKGAECGLWVVDDASWRPPKIRAATNADTGLALTHILVGSTTNVKTATEPVPVTC
jgi:hypothetical protein